MAVDNDLYNRPGDIWWDENQPLSTIRTAINPARLAYFGDVLRGEGVEPSSCTVLDIGCGGGLFAEEWARMGARVIGVDPSESSLQTARDHAGRSGLEIDYRHGTGEHLPVESGSIDIACCVDVLEHVEDLDAVLAETARVLKPGGLYLYDTINRTRLSRLVMIKLFQEWSPFAWMPANLHDWDHFITPAELQSALDRHGLHHRDLAGIGPGVKPPQLVRLLRQLRKGRLTYGEFGRRASFVVSRDTRVSYAGYASRA